MTIFKYFMCCQLFPYVHAEGASLRFSTLTITTQLLYLIYNNIYIIIFIILFLNIYYIIIFIFIIFIFIIIIFNY